MRKGRRSLANVILPPKPTLHAITCTWWSTRKHTALYSQVPSSCELIIHIAVWLRDAQRYFTSCTPRDYSISERETGLAQLEDRKKRLLSCLFVYVCVYNSSFAVHSIKKSPVAPLFLYDRKQNSESMFCGKKRKNVNELVEVGTERLR